MNLLGFFVGYIVGALFAFAVIVAVMFWMEARKR